MRRPGDLDLVSFGAGVGAAALGVAADTGPFLGGIAVGLGLAWLVRARTTAHMVLWLVVPLALWIGASSWTFLVGVALLGVQAGGVALHARGRSETATDLELAARVTLAVAAGVTAVSLLVFGNVYR